ncbi:MAG: aldo/keto reductase [Anaerolineae bacterium]|nr:aldo/keto reductase [Anaerolineae bacterium]
MKAPMTRRLGRAEIESSAMGLGSWAIGGPFWRGDAAVGWGEVDDEESVAAIRRAIELGITLFDTSDVYGAGHSEEVLGRALEGHRREVVLATKFGNTFDPSTRQITGADATPAYIRRACEASLRRLRTDWIDLYQFHLGGHDLEEAVEVRDTLESLVAEGKIRAYGWSTDDPARARLFAEGLHCATVQHQMNALNDAPEMLALCEEMDLASINRGPLAMGLLTGKYRADSRLGDADVRGARGPAWMRYFQDGKPSPEWYAKVQAIRDILTSGGRTLAQGALAWLWARSERTIPIPGFRTVAQVEENCAAMRYGPLDAGQLAEIDRLLGRQGKGS